MNWYTRIPECRSLIRPITLADSMLNIIYVLPKFNCRMNHVLTKGKNEYFNALQPVHSKGDQSWVFIGRTDAKAETPILWATSCDELTHWKRLWCWEGLGAGGEGDDRGWDGWMASPTRWTWVWVNSRSWWWTGRPGMLQFMELQRAGHNWATELNWLFLLPCS